MAVWIYRKIDGELESELIDPTYLQNHLDTGWSVDLEPLEAAVIEEPAEEATEEEPVVDIRETAREAGIEGWDTKRLKTLEGELNDD